MSENVQPTLDDLQENIRPYLPPLMRRLAITYGLPVLAVLLLNIILPLLMPDFVPLSTATILTFAVHLLVLYFGWRALEQRTHATALFVSYVHYSSQRRDFEKGGHDGVTLQMVADAADRFVHSAAQNGIEPGERA